MRDNLSDTHQNTIVSTILSKTKKCSGFMYMNVIFSSEKIMLMCSILFINKVTTSHYTKLTRYMWEHIVWYCKQTFLKKYSDYV